MNKRKILKLLSIAMSINILAMSDSFAISSIQSSVFSSRNIAKEVIYGERDITYSLENGKNLKQRINLIEADLNDKDLELVFSKSNDKTLGMQNLTSQINNVINKGKNVTAGINADFFNTEIGASVGPQVCDEEIITAYAGTSDEYRYPVFTIDKDKKASIRNMHFNGVISTRKDNGQASSINIDTVNRYDQYDNIKYSVYNQLIVLTPNYNNTGIINTSKYAPCDLLTVVTDVKDANGEALNGGLKLGREYTGTVNELGNKSGQVTIPKGGIVIASNGSKAAWIRDNLNKGDKIKFNANFDVPNLKDAISGYTYLVKDDRALTGEEMIQAGTEKELVNARKPRTAIGITKDSKLVTIALEKGNYTNKASDGATLPELAEIMKQLGAVVALNFDGGGSTQMNVKKYASNLLDIVNNPTDGRERNIVNGIVFVNKANKSDKIKSINIEKNINIYKNSSYSFNLLGEDINCYSYDFVSNKNKIKWTSDEKVGKFNEQGVFKSASSSAKGNVSVEIDGVKDISEVNVVDKIGELKLNSSSILYLNKDDVYSFKPVAKTEDGQNIIIDKSSIKWSVKGNVGSIDENGVLKIKEKEGSGEVIAEAGEKVASIKIEVGKSRFVIDDFENPNTSLYDITGFVGGNGTFTTEKSYKGNGSLKVSYDYDSKWTKQYNGTINIVPKGNNEKYKTEILPKKIGVSVYGDGQAPWLRGVITDGNGQKVVVDFVKKINWKDKWADVYADIPQDIKLPIKLEYIYMVETNKALHYKGDVYFDDIRFLYTDKEE